MISIYQSASNEQKYHYTVYMELCKAIILFIIVLFLVILITIFIYILFNSIGPTMVYMLSIFYTLRMLRISYLRGFLGGIVFMCVTNVIENTPFTVAIPVQLVMEYITFLAYTYEFHYRVINPIYDIYQCFIETFIDINFFYSNIASGYLPNHTLTLRAQYFRLERALCVSNGIKLLLDSLYQYYHVHYT